jgi:sugar phosphate isomerase/epimerase
MRPRDDRSTTRREAIAAALTTAGALALGGRARALADDEPKKASYGPFKMGIQSYSLRHYKLAEALDKTRQLGLRYWESFNAHIPAAAEKSESFQYAARLTKNLDVDVIGYGVVGFSKDHDKNEQLFKFAKAFGVRYLSCDPDPDAFESLDKLVAEYGIPVGIHNHGPGHRYAKIDTIAEAIKGHHEKIGCCIDTGHFLRSREDPVRAAEVFGKRIYGVHLKDVKDAKTFTVLGQGDLRTADLLKVLAGLKYDYCLALEYEENEQDPIADIRACLEAVQKAAKGL